MAATSKNWPGNIPDSDIDPDSPLTTGLMQDIRDSLTNLAERVGDPAVYSENVKDHAHDGVTSANVLTAGLYGDASSGDHSSVGSVLLPKYINYNNLTINGGHVYTVPGSGILRVRGNLTVNGTLQTVIQAGPWGVGGAQVGGTGNTGTGTTSVNPWTTGGAGGATAIGPNREAGGGGGAGAAGSGGAGGAASGLAGGLGGVAQFTGFLGTEPYGSFFDFARHSDFWTWALGGGGGGGGEIGGGAMGGNGGNGGGIMCVFVGGNITGTGVIQAPGFNGGTSASGAGGGGGGAGAVLIFCGGSCIGGTLTIRANGAAGGNGGGGDIAGGGGGGGGGVSSIVAKLGVAVAALQASGGAGGTGANGGSNGGNGGTGIAESLQSGPEFWY